MAGFEILLEAVDKASLFIISFGGSVETQLKKVRGYSTIQAGFVKFTYNHHPLVYLEENVRSYISDYCNRVFGKIFELLNKKGHEQNYSTLRRFITRLSLFSSYDFVVSEEREITKLINTLQSINVIKLITVDEKQKYILLRREILNG